MNNHLNTMKNLMFQGQIICHKLIAHVAVFSCAILFSFQTQALPQKIEADRHLQAAANEMREDTIAWKRVSEALQAAEATGVKMPESFNFHLGEAFNETGEYQKAVQRITSYLESYGQRGKFYKAALDQLNTAEKNRSQQVARESAAAEIEKSWETTYFRYWVMDTGDDATCERVRGRISLQVENDAAVRSLDCSCTVEAVNHPAFRGRTQSVCKGSLQFNAKLSAASMLKDRDSTNKWGLSFRGKPFDN